jgi:hypothetical protein
MRYSSRFFLYAPFGGLLLLAAIAAVHWWIAATALAKHLDAINGREIMPGVRLIFSAKRLAGFPFRMDTILTNLRLEVAEVDGPVVWTSENFAMHALTYGRTQAILEAAGRQTLTWTDAHGATHRFAFLPGTFRASAILKGGTLQRFDCEIVDLGGDGLRAGDAQLHMRTTQKGIDLFVRLSNARISGGYAAALGPNLRSLTASASLAGSPPLDRMLAGTVAPTEALERWRNAGGALRVSDLSLAAARQRSTFAGSLSLDAAHDLSGTLKGAAGTLQFAGPRLVLR